MLLTLIQIPYSLYYDDSVINDHKVGINYRV